MSHPALRHRAATVLAAMLAAGCASLPRPLPPSGEAWRAHRAEVAQLTRWQLAGRLGVRSGGRAWSASLRWRASPLGYALHLSGPLGRGALAIEGGPGAVRVRDSEGNEYRGADPDRLAAELLGWPLPVQALSWWVRGLAAPGLPVDTLATDDQGRLRRLVQDGWQVEVEDYVREAGVALPRRLRVTALQRHLEVRLAIRDWEVG